MDLDRNSLTKCQGLSGIEALEERDMMIPYINSTYIESWKGLK